MRNLSKQTSTLSNTAEIVKNIGWVKNTPLPSNENMRILLITFFLNLLCAGMVYASDNQVDLACKINEVQLEAPEPPTMGIKKSVSITINSERQDLIMGGRVYYYSDLENFIGWRSILELRSIEFVSNWYLDKITGVLTVYAMECREECTNTHTSFYTCKEAKKLF